MRIKGRDSLFMGKKNEFYKSRKRNTHIQIKKYVLKQIFI